MKLGLILMLFSSAVWSHGSSHPKWSEYIDAVGNTYKKCSGVWYSEYGQLIVNRREYHVFKPDRDYQVTVAPDHLVSNETYNRFINGELCWR